MWPYFSRNSIVFKVFKDSEKIQVFKELPGLWKFSRVFQDLHVYGKFMSVPGLCIIMRHFLRISIATLLS